jgi:hypothetical protein
MLSAVCDTAGTAHVGAHILCACADARSAAAGKEYTMTSTTAIAPPGTLPEALDLLNEAEFYGRRLPKAARDGAARTIASRFGGEGAYARTFALTADERAAGLRVFTGELLTHASARHVAAQESCRALRLLADAPAAAKRAGERGNAIFVEYVMSRIDPRLARIFCCGNCDTSMWRHLAAGGLDHGEQRLDTGMRVLKAQRDGKGGWRRFPFHYTVLALTEIGTGGARGELRYARPALERRQRRAPQGEAPYAQRRHDVVVRALGMV